VIAEVLNDLVNANNGKRRVHEVKESKSQP
jgi:hypothetical protein